MWLFMAYFVVIVAGFRNVAAYARENKLTLNIH